MLIKINPKKTVLKWIPILTWLPNYHSELFVSDLVAGITVGLTLIPQVIAYAALAGVSPEYGLYSAFAGSFVYMVFGTTPEVNIGPTALISLLTFTYTHGTSQKMTVLFCLLSGIIQFLCGIFRLGFLIEFVSIPVTIGFTAATSIVIASTQTKNLLGLKIDAEYFIQTWQEIFKHFRETHMPDFWLSIGCCVILICLRQLKEINIKPKDGKTLSSNQQTIKKILWFISVGRNAMVVVGCAFISVFFEHHYHSVPFHLTGLVNSGLPPFEVPQLSIEYGNQTHSFVENVSHIGSGLVVLPLIALLQNIAIAKAFSKGRVVNATQEMMTLGLCNIVGSFFSSYPVSGSFSRSAVSNASGIRTPMGGLYTGAMVLLALSFLTPYFYYIPKATLSSVIICAILFMIEFSAIKPMWNTNKLDMIPLFGTFFACIFIGIEIGILVGIGLDLFIVLCFTARPVIIIEKSCVPAGFEYMSIKPMSGLLFPAVDHIRTAVSKIGGSLPIVLDGHYIQRTDYTACEGLNALVNDLKKIERSFILYDIQPHIMQMLLVNKSQNTTFVIANNTNELNDIMRELSINKKNLYTLSPQDMMMEVRMEDKAYNDIETNNPSTKENNDTKIDITNL